MNVVNILDMLSDIGCSNATITLSESSFHEFDKQLYEMHGVRVNSNNTEFKEGEFMVANGNCKVLFKKVEVEPSLDKICHKCGCQIHDPFGMGVIIHDVEKCGGIFKQKSDV